MSRPAFLGLALLTFASAGVAGCQYGDGAPCEINGDCASGRCCGATGTLRGSCRPADMECETIRTDSGTPDSPDAFVMGEDAPIDSGIDAPIDSGLDAPEDTGMDAGDDAGDDAGASDVGDTGTDVPA